MKGERFLLGVSYLTFHLSTFTFHLFLHPDGFDERWQRVGDAFEDVLAAFAHLELLPVFAVIVLFVVDEGMACDEFVADGVVHVGGSEEPLLLGNLAVEEDVHGKVAELLLEVVKDFRVLRVLKVVKGNHCFAEFVDLLDGEVAEAFHGLLAVPGALFAQGVQDVGEALEGVRCAALVRFHRRLGVFR